MSPTNLPGPALGCSQTIKAPFVPLSCSAFNLRAPGPCESAPGVPPAVQVRRRHAAGVSFRGGFLSPFPSGLVFLPTCNPRSQAVGKLRNRSLILGIEVPILSRSNHTFEKSQQRVQIYCLSCFFSSCGPELSPSTWTRGQVELLQVPGVLFCAKTMLQTTDSAPTAQEPAGVAVLTPCCVLPPEKCFPCPRCPCWMTTSATTRSWRIQRAS